MLCDETMNLTGWVDEVRQEALAEISRFADPRGEDTSACGGLVRTHPEHPRSDAPCERFRCVGNPSSRRSSSEAAPKEPPTHHDVFDFRTRGERLIYNARVTPGI